MALLEAVGSKVRAGLPWRRLGVQFFFARIGQLHSPNALKGIGTSVFIFPTEEEFPFGFFGEGSSAEEAMNDFLNVFEAMRKDYFQSTGENTDTEFEFVHDTSAFLQK